MDCDDTCGTHFADGITCLCGQHSVGATRLLNYTISPSTANKSVTFKSSNPKVVMVNSNGLIAAIKKGSSKITIETSKGKKATIKIKVK